MNVSFGLFLFYNSLCAEEQEKLIYEIHISGRVALCSGEDPLQTFCKS